MGKRKKKKRVDTGTQIPEELLAKPVNKAKCLNVEFPQNVGKTERIQFYEELGTFLKNLDEELTSLRDQLSKLDKSIDEVLHLIENKEKVNLYDAWVLVQRLQTLLQNRREIKMQLILASQLKAQQYGQLKVPEQYRYKVQFERALYEALAPEFLK